MKIFLVTSNLLFGCKNNPFSLVLNLFKSDKYIKKRTKQDDKKNVIFHKISLNFNGFVNLKSESL